MALGICISCVYVEFSSFVTFSVRSEQDLVEVLSLEGCGICDRFIDMAETLCQKRALAAFHLDPEKWGGK